MSHSFTVTEGHLARYRRCRELVTLPGVALPHCELVTLPGVALPHRELVTLPGVALPHCELVTLPGVVLPHCELVTRQNPPRAARANPRANPSPTHNARSHKPTRHTPAAHAL